VRNNTEINRHLLWTLWFLEIAHQIDPRFRRDLRTMTAQIEKSASLTYNSLHNIGYRVSQVGRLMKIEYESNEKGNTLFAIFRSFFWEHSNEELERIRISKDPEDVERFRAFEKLLSDPLRVDVVVLLSLLPFEGLSSFEDLCRKSDKPTLPDFSESLRELIDEFGDCVAS
jgi:hypothetical protein